MIKEDWTRCKQYCENDEATKGGFTGGGKKKARGCTSSINVQSVYAKIDL